MGFAKTLMDEPKQKEKETQWSDYTHTLGAGLDRAGQLGGSALSAVGLESVGKPIKSFYKEREEKQQENYSEPYKKELQKQYISEEGGPGEAWTSIPKLSHSVISSLPATALGMGTGAGAAGALTRAGMSSGMAGIVGMGAGEGAVAGGMSAQESHDKVMDAPLEDIKQTEEFQRAFWSQPKDKPKTERIKQARKEAARDAATMSGLTAGGATGLLGAPSGHYMGRLIGGEVADTTIGTVSKSAGLEGVQEAPQEAAETVAGNVAERKYAGSDVGITEGAGEAAAAGGMAGMAMGGAASATISTINTGIAKKNEAVNKALQSENTKLLEEIINDEDVQRAKSKAKQVLKDGYIENEDGGQRTLSTNEYAQIKSHFPDIWNQWLQEKSDIGEETKRKQQVKKELQEFQKGSLQVGDVLDTLDKRVKKDQVDLDSTVAELEQAESSQRRNRLQQKADQLQTRIRENQQAAQDIQNKYQEVPLPILQNILSTENPQLAAEAINDRVAKQQKSRENVREYNTDTGEVDTTENRPSFQAQPLQKQDPEARDRADEEIERNRQRREAGTEVAVSDQQQTKQDKTYNTLAVKRARDKSKNTQRQIKKLKTRLGKNQDSPKKQKELHKKLDQYEQRLKDEEQALGFIQENVDKVPKDFALHVTKANKPIEAAQSIKRRLAEQQKASQQVSVRPEEPAPNQQKQPQPQEPETGHPVPNVVPGAPAQQETTSGQQQEQVETPNQQEIESGKQESEESRATTERAVRENFQEAEEAEREVTRKEAIDRIIQEAQDPSTDIFQTAQHLNEEADRGNITDEESIAIEDALDNQLDAIEERGYVDRQQFLADFESSLNNQDQVEDETDTTEEVTTEESTEEVQEETTTQEDQVAQQAEDHQQDVLRRESEYETYDKSVGRIRELGGLQLEDVKTQHGKAGVEELRKKFGPNFVTKNGEPMDTAAQILADESPELGLESEKESLWNFLTERVKNTKQIGTRPSPKTKKSKTKKEQTKSEETKESGNEQTVRDAFNEATENGKRSFVKIATVKEKANLSDDEFVNAVNYLRKTGEIELTGGYDPAYFSKSEKEATKPFSEEGDGHFVMKRGQNWKEQKQSESKSKKERQKEQVEKAKGKTKETEEQQLSKTQLQKMYHADLIQLARDRGVPPEYPSGRGLKKKEELIADIRENQKKTQQKSSDNQAAQTTQKKTSGQKKSSGKTQKTNTKQESESKTKNDTKDTQSKTQSTSEATSKEPYEVPLSEYNGDKMTHFQAVKSAIRDGNLSPEKALEIHGKDYSVKKWSEYKQATGEEAKPANESEAKSQDESESTGNEIESIDDITEDNAADAIMNILNGDTSFKTPTLQEAQAQKKGKKTKAKPQSGQQQKQVETSEQTDIIDLIYKKARGNKADQKVKALVRKKMPQGSEVKELGTGDIIVKAPKGRSLLIRPNEQIWAAGEDKMGMTEGPKSIFKKNGIMLNNSAVITLSKNYPNELETTLNHELFHAAKMMALTESQQKLLDKKFNNEEEQAEAYEDWMLQKEPKHPYFKKIQKMFDGVDKIFKQLQTGQAWKNPVHSKGNAFYQPKQEDISYKPNNKEVLEVAKDDLEAYELDTAVPLFKPKNRMAKDNPDKQETLDAFGMAPEHPIVDKVKNALSFDKAVERIVDRYHPMRQLEDDFEEQTGISVSRDESGYIATRLGTSTKNMMVAMLEDGIPVRKEGAIQIEGDKEGLYHVLESLGDDMYYYFMRRVVQRSDKLKQQDPNREKLIDDEKRAEAIEMYQQRENKELWDEIDRKLEKLQKGVVQFAVNEGVIAQESADLFEYASYLPFYRKIQEDMSNQETTLSPSFNKQYIDNGIRELKGSKNPIDDPLKNLIQNWGHLLSESIQNNSLRNTLAIAEQTEWDGRYVAEPISDPANAMKSKQSVGIKINGTTKYYKVNDAALFNAMTDMRKEKLDNTLAKILRGAKKTLTYGATIGPVFRIRNGFRDSLHVAMMNDSFRPFIDTWKGLHKAMAQSPEYKELRAAGGSFSGGYLQSGDPENLSAEIGKLVAGDKKRSKYNPVRWLKLWQEIGDAFENAARVELYSKLRNEGKTIPDAAYQAKDIMDFTLSGNSGSVQWAIQAIPFLNARLQGLWKITKETKNQENVKRSSIGKMGAVYAIASLTLLGLTAADDENWAKYSSLPDYEKFMYHHLFIGDTHIRLPMPFELGAIFGAGPVAAAESFAGKEDAQHMLGFLGHTMGNTLHINPLPQVGRPLVEQWANKDFFTGREIIPIGMQQLKPTEQADPWTSKTLKQYGKLIDKTGADNVLGGYFSFLKSPKRMENLIRDYFATIGTATLGATDMALTWADVGHEDPARSMKDYPFVGAFVRSTTVRRSGYTNDVYDMVSQLDEITATARYYRRNRNPEALKQWLTDNAGKLKYEGQVSALKKQMSNIRKRQRMVWRNDNLSKAEKRRQLDKLTQQRNKMVRNHVNDLKEEKVW